MKDYERHKLYDLAAAAPLILWYGWGVWRAFPGFSRTLEALTGGPNLMLSLSLFTQGATIAFSGLLVILLLARRPPVAKAAGTVPRLAGIAGTFLALGFLYMPRVELPYALIVLSAALAGIGLTLTVYALFALGRSFSIMAEARHLVTSGPYAFVRHPVYLFEEIAVIGIAIQYAQPWAFILVAVHLAVQLVRIGFEEKVLTRAFPDYAGYAARTSRLIPGLY